jgi:hypothetical protein
MHTHDPREYLPDIRDGLTHRERIVLQCLYDLQSPAIAVHVIVMAISLIRSIGTASSS